jgi:hypothetical protein
MGRCNQKGSLEGYGVDSVGSGWGTVAVCCEICDEPSGSCATELVTIVEGLKNRDSYNVCCLTYKCHTCY